MTDPVSFEDHFLAQVRRPVERRVAVQQSGQVLRERYADQPGEYLVDEDGETAYQVTHPSGFTARTYGGPMIEIGHRDTPGQTHDAIDVGSVGRSGAGYEIHPGMVNGSPADNHAMLRRELDHWVGTHGQPLSAAASQSGHARTSVLHKTAHDSGDGETIYHCPFCGSGQVIARSDRTIECQFCHVCFTVQVQPQYSAFPQTVNGVPVEVPGMPGQVGMDPTDPMAPAGDPTAPDGAQPDPTDPDAAADPAAGAQDDAAPADDSDEGNPFARNSARMSREAAKARLALIYSGDRQAALAAIRRNRSTRG